MKFKIWCLLFSSLIVLTVPSGAQQPSAKAKPNIKLDFVTTTALAVTSEGSAVTTVDSGNVVELTATVLASSKPVTVGKVNFCDASALYCTDIHILGSAQLTSAGTAVFKFIPGIGFHYYQAVFMGNAIDAGGVSSIPTLTVQGQYPTTTAIVESGPEGNYTLKATVTGMGGPIPPVGNVTFVDLANDEPTVVATVPVSTGPVGLSWSNPETALTGNHPLSPVVADFNQDGIPDLAFANYSDDTVSILLGNGNGTFTAAADQISQLSPNILAVGDFLSDGHPGFAVNEYDSSQVAINNGYGDGRFYGWGTLYTGAIYSSAIVVADFDGDGNQDVAIVDDCPQNCATLNATGAVSVFLLAGESSATQIPSFATGVIPNSMVTGDFNGDGIADLAVANTGGSISGNNVMIFLGNGDGTFNAVSGSIATGTGYPTLAVADFNGDGKADLAVTNEGANKVTILLGNGDGSFTQNADSPATGNLPSSIGVGDFNGDGIPDLAVTNSTDNTVTILLGKGDGTFTPQPTALATDLYPNSLAVGDFTGSGTADLAVANYEGNTLAILLSQNTPTATATATGISFPANSGTHRIEARFLGDSYHGSSISSTVTLKAPVTPFITWATPTAVSYGTALSATQLDATASVAGKFVYTPALGAVLNDGSNTLSVTFTPTDTVDYTTATSTVQLVVNPAPLAKLSATRLSFGSQGIQTASGSASVTLTNSGTAALSITSISVTGANASSFVFANSCGTSLAIGANCSIHGHFQPLAVGALTAAITIIDNASGSPHSIALSGTGIGVPLVKLSATSLSFGSDNVGVAGGSGSVSMTNTGTAALSIAGISVTGAGASSFVFANSCGTSLAVGANCSIHGHFAPTIAGAITAAITITDNAAGSPQTISLSGTGLGANASLSANNLSFGTQAVGTASASKTVTLTNTGNAALTIASIAVTGTNASSFVFANGCGTSLAAGANCTIHGHFGPTKTGALTAAITITDNAAGSPQTISLSGTGQ